MSGAGLVLTSVAGMVLGCLVVGPLGQVVEARARADSAADLTALAVATRLARGEPAAAACATGAAVAGAHGARPAGCAVDGPVATVTVALDLQVLGLRAEVPSTARAGPAP